MCEHDGAASLPGGIGISLLKVYDREAPDGLVGGSPHIDLACAEGYYVVAGTGAVQILNPTGVRRDRAEPHRGLVRPRHEPPAGEQRRPDHPHADVEQRPAGGQRRGADLPAGAPRRPGVVPRGDGARRHRRGAAPVRDDAQAPSLQGFQALRPAYDADGPAALDDFYAAAAALVRPLVGDWRKRWEAGAKRLADPTGTAFDALEKGDPEYLRAAQLHGIPEPTETGRHGMCGRLETYEIAAG
jgi:hypothetical protein